MDSQLIVQAWKRREKILSATTNTRILDGIGDGIPNLYIDRYDGVLLAHYLPQTIDNEEEATTVLPQVLKEAYVEMTVPFTPRAFYLRTHLRDPQDNRERSPLLVAGVPEERLEVTAGLGRYIVKPGGSLHAGLYTDMREVRDSISAISEGKRVLNLFSFTGSLGIAAALGGAPQVCHVDSSPAALTWAKENWALNSEGRECDMRFICDDCRHFLERELKRVERGERRTDVVIVDPPSFGRGRKAIFSFRKDIVDLLVLCFKILTPEGTIFLTTNSRDYTPQSLEKIALKASEEARFKIKKFTTILPPKEDFTAVGADSIGMRGILVGTPPSASARLS